MTRKQISQVFIGTIGVLCIVQCTYGMRKRSVPSFEPAQPVDQGKVVCPDSVAEGVGIDNEALPDEADGPVGERESAVALQKKDVNKGKEKEKEKEEVSGGMSEKGGEQGSEDTQFSVWPFVLTYLAGRNDICNARLVCKESARSLRSEMICRRLEKGVSTSKLKLIVDKFGPKMDETNSNEGRDSVMQWQDDVFSVHLGDKFSDPVTDNSLDLLRTFPKLGVLYLDHCSGVTDEGVSRLLAHHAAVKALSVTSCDQLTGSIIQFLPTDFMTLVLNGCKNICREHLNLLPESLLNLALASTSITNEDIWVISTQCLRLKKLNLSSCKGISDSCLSYLSTSIKELFLRECKKMKDLSSLQRFTHLSTLDLTGCKKVVRACLPSSLLNLDLSCTDATDESMEILSTQCPNLTCLNLSNCGMVTDKGIACLPKTIITLNLTGTQVEDLGALKEFQALGKLDLSYTSVSDLSVLEKLTNLRELDIRYCTNVMSAALASLPNTLTRLSLSGCTGIEDFSVLEKLTNLRELDVRYCTNVTSAALASLPKTIIKLNLDGCTGIEDLSIFEQFTNLRVLDLSGCNNIDCSSFTKLPANLKILRIRECDQIKDGSLRFLQGAHLIKLELSGCQELSVEELAYLPGGIVKLDLASICALEEEMESIQFKAHFCKLGKLRCLILPDWEEYRGSVLECYRGSDIISSYILMCFDYLKANPGLMERMGS